MDALEKEDVAAHMATVGEWPAWRLDRLNERVTDVETVLKEYDPKEMRYEIERLSARVGTLNKVGIAIVIALCTSAITTLFVAIQLAAS